MTHPTVDGTSQAARRRPELDPAFAALDGRSTADLLAFARAFAGGLHYVDDQGQPQGDWQGLFPDVDGLAEAADYLRAPERFSAARAAPHARPHFALLLAAMDLLGLARDQLNHLAARHLDYFYREVLRMVGKPAVADRLHVLLAPDRGVERLLLPAGASLKAGKDAAGRERLFRTRTDGLASPARVAELRSLRVDIRTTDIRQASRQYLVGGTRQQAFMAMWRIVLGDPLPGDALPVPVWPGLPPAAAAGALPAQVDFDTLVQADRIPAFVGDALGWPLFDDFRRLMQLRAERLAADAGDWQGINRLLAGAGRRRDPAFVLPPAAADDFHANLRAALGLSAVDYRQLYNRLPEVDSVEDAFSLLDRESEVQAFVRDELHLPLDDFKAMMQLKLRLGGQWAEIAALVEAGGQRRDPARLMTPEQRGVRNTDALLAAAYARLDWPVPGGLDGLHQAFQAIEAYFCMSVEAFHFTMSVAQRSLARPPTQGADTAADDADWARVHALCAEANAALQFRRRRDLLLQAAAPGLAAGDPARALVEMLTAVLGEPLALHDGLQRLAGLGVGAADLAALQALAGLPKRSSAADWRRAAAVLEVAQRNRQAFVPAAPERVRWHHAYPALDATAVRAPGQANDVPAPRWWPFGTLALATQRQAVPAAALGWAVASPLLALAEGGRSVQWWLGLDGDPSCFDDEAMRRLLPSTAGGSADGAVAGGGAPGSVHPFQVECSGAEGWLVPATVQVLLLPGVDSYPAVAGVDSRSWRTLQVSITLQEQQPAVVPPSLALHGINGPQPLLRLMLRPAWDEAQDRHHTAYQTLARLRLKRWRLAVSVSGLAGLALRNDGAVLDPKKPFEPFGPAPSSGARLSIGHAELVGKSLDRLVLRGAWMGAPVSLIEHYRNYEGAPKPDSFTLRAGLRDGLGFKPGPELLPLFGADRAGAWALALSLLPETGRLMTEPPASDDVADWRRCWVLELAGDLQHAAYPARALRKSMEMAAAVAASMTGGAKPVADAYVVNPPYTPKLKSLVVDYSASAEQPAVLAAPGRNSGVLLHWHPFGHEALQSTTASTAAPIDPTAALMQDDPDPNPLWVPGMSVPLLPAYGAEGELYIGLASVQPPQRLSLLFQVAEGTADPDAAPQPVRWSVLGGNRWRSLQAGPLEGNLLADGTRGLVQSGIVELQLPVVAPSTLLPGADWPPTAAGSGRYWLRLQRERAIAGVCDLVALHPHAVLAERELIGGDPPGDDLADPLPAGLVSGPQEPVPGLAKLLQPYSSFGGRPAEQGAHFDTRVSERLRHRQRALTPWDYEHLVLEQFAQLHKVKCLRADELGGEPGRVDLVVVPDIANRFPSDPFAPKASADLIREVESFLADKVPAFAQLRVKNPYFVALKVRCGVRFMPGTDEGYCRDRLNDELNRFLSPWAYDEGADLVIGGSIYANSIINFIEQRDYVDYIAGLRLFTVEQGRPTLVPEGPGYHVSASRPDAVLVAAPSHEFDVIALTDYRVAGFGGIGNLRIELDFSVG